ncbi:hypothetical protein scyTo_0021351 [Scyliorhinus torazame]|uniref:DH domain-containing protein n=1 Tax=Scyliorhinus torazame TaxID=75743 RepID=A0A401Q741_SCYTO|nr:hypothetical protein [Scyliorhinus torazame]
MASTDNGPPQTEMQKPAAKQQTKPPLKPKPPALGLGARKLDGAQASAILEASAGAAKGSGEAQSTCPLVPSRRRAADEAAAADVLSSSGNVRRKRELLQQALGLPEGEEAAAKEKPAREPACSKPAKDPPAKSVPVPRVRLKRMARVAAPPDPPVNGDGCHEPSVAKRPASDLQPSWEAPTGLELEATREQDEAAEGPEANWHCSPTCPCMCHLKRPGMVLVWRPVTEGKEDSDESDNSLSDSSENAAKAFCYVLHVNDEDREGVSENEGKANRRDAPEGSFMETAGTGEDAGRLHSASSVPVEVAIPGGGGPPVLPKLGGGPEAGAPPSPSPPRAPVRSNQASALADISAPGGDTRPVACNQLPKPPRRKKPISQSSLDSPQAPAVLRRRCGQVHRPNVNPHSHIRQRYTATDLDRISKCVDGLNLHIQALQLPRKERDLPSISPPSAFSALKPLIPQITRSAPPSPKEKHLQVVYDEVDIGVDEDSGSNDYEVHLEILDIRPSKSDDQKMTNWESQFESEPLYQTYRETVINKAIKRQTLMRDSSKTSEDDVYESIQDSDRPSLLGPRTQAPGNSLWQDLSTVRQSGILNELSQRERRLQESLFEVLTSEASYLRSLNVLTEQFMDNKDLNETIIFRDKKTLFSCIVRVKEVSERYSS